MHSQEERKAALLVALSKAAFYGVREKIPKELLSAAMVFINDNFSHLGPLEIEAAYSWYFSQPENKAGQAYGGQFTISSLGSILTAYSEMRKKVVSAIIKKAHDEKAEQDRLERHEKRQAEFEAAFPKMIEEAKAAENLDIFEVPVYWYDVLEARGKLNVETEAKVELMAFAERLHVASSRDGFLNLNSSITGKFWKTEAAQKRGFTDKVRNIAKKLAVWIYVLGRDITDINVEDYLKERVEPTDRLSWRESIELLREYEIFSKEFEQAADKLGDNE